MYKILQIKLLFNWTPITIFLYITNIFLYNLTLCEDIPTVTKFEKPYDLKEPEKVENSFWEPISRRVYDYIVGIRVDDYVVPKATHDMQEDLLNPCNKSLPNQKMINNEPDGNITCEDSSPLPLNSSSLPLNSSSLPLDSLEVITNSPEHLKRVDFLETNMFNVIKGLELAYPHIDDIRQIPDSSIKNLVNYSLIKWNDNSEWLCKTIDEYNNNKCELNVRLAIILDLVNDPDAELTLLERKILCHLGTSMTMLNSAGLINVPYEKFINTELYTKTYAQFASSL